MPRSMSIVAAVLFVLCADITAAAQLPYECGTLTNHYGPFDYTDPQMVQVKLPVVERHHFNRDVAQAKRGMTALYPGTDLDYTLRAFPNHHGALYAMMLYTTRYPVGRRPQGLNYPPFCYFERAVTFAPDDATSRLVYGLYLNKIGQTEKALEQYESAVNISPDYAEAHYNYGLILLEHGRPEKALEHAQRAYEIGFPLDGLKNKLRQAGVWRDEPAETD